MTWRAGLARDRAGGLAPLVAESQAGDGFLVLGEDERRYEPALRIAERRRGQAGRAPAEQHPNGAGSPAAAIAITLIVGGGWDSAQSLGGDRG